MIYKGTDTIQYNKNKTGKKGIMVFLTFCIIYLDNFFSSKPNSVFKHYILFVMFLASRNKLNWRKQDCLHPQPRYFSYQILQQPVYKYIYTTHDDIINIWHYLLLMITTQLYNIVHEYVQCTYSLACFKNKLLFPSRILDLS